MDLVVVGVDGSPSSLDAVQVAAAEAGARGVGLRLVHAFVWPSVHLPPGGPPWNPAMARVRESVDGTLIEAEERARRAVPQVSVVREVAVGEPLMVLEIESRTASLVVVGSRGLSAFGSLLLGSTAVHLAAHGRCPVLVVRGGPTRAVPYCWRSTAHRRAREPLSSPSPRRRCAAWTWWRFTSGTPGASGPTRALVIL